MPSCAICGEPVRAPSLFYRGTLITCARCESPCCIACVRGSTAGGTTRLCHFCCETVCSIDTEDAPDVLASVRSSLSTKLVLVGDSGVGKSCVFRALKEERFSDSYVSSIGVDFNILKREVRGVQLKLLIWDTAGQERFRSIAVEYIPGAQAAVIVADAFELAAQRGGGLKTWGDEVAQRTAPGTPIVLLVNKIDTVDETNPELAAAVRAAKRALPPLAGVSFVSCKTGAGMQEFREKLDQVALAAVLHRAALPSLAPAAEEGFHLRAFISSAFLSAAPELLAPASANWGTAAEGAFSYCAALWRLLSPAAASAPLGWRVDEDAAASPLPDADEAAACLATAANAAHAVMRVWAEPACQRGAAAGAASPPERACAIACLLLACSLRVLLALYRGGVPPLGGAEAAAGRLLCHASTRGGAGVQLTMAAALALRALVHVRGTSGEGAADQWRSPQWSRVLGLGGAVQSPAIIAWAKVCSLVLLQQQQHQQQSAAAADVASLCGADGGGGGGGGDGGGGGGGAGGAGASAAAASNPPRFTPHATDLFFSYAWGAGGHRRPLARVMVAGLRAAGYSVWFDEDCMASGASAQGGTEGAMAAAIGAASAVVILLSPDYAASANCKKEAEFADNQKKPRFFVNAEPSYSPHRFDAANPAASGGWLSMLVGKALWAGGADAAAWGSREGGATTLLAALGGDERVQRTGGIAAQAF